MLKELLELLDQKEFIKAGSAREVYSLNAQWVVKIPINVMGLRQNEIESSIYEKFKKSKYSPLIVPCYKESSRPFLFMKKVIPLPPLKQETIVSFIQREYPSVRHHDSDLIRQFIREANLHDEDVFTSDAWGIDGEHTSLLDYGCTSELFNQYYRW